MLAKDGEGAIDIVMGDGTGCQRQDTVRASSGESHLSMTVDGEAHMVTVVPWVITRDCFQHWWIVKAADLV